MAVVLRKALLLHGEAGPLTRPSSQSNQRCFQKYVEDALGGTSRSLWPDSPPLSTEVWSLCLRCLPAFPRASLG